MLTFLRSRRAAALSQVSFCDSCAEACTAACRATARHERTRTAALTYAAGR